MQIAYRYAAWPTGCEEEFEMMTKQAKLKKQAYESDLKSRALSVLLYLIDRSDKELTCFPAIPTMAKQLHISVSTVKRALHELTETGYIKKDFRYRENNKGQTSNLYTLVLFENTTATDDAKDSAGRDHAETCEPVAESWESGAERIDFDTLKKAAEIEKPEEKTEKSKEKKAKKEEKMTALKDGEPHSDGVCHNDMTVHMYGRPYLGVRMKYYETEVDIFQNLSENAGDFPACKPPFPCWTGEGASLVPP